MTLLTQHRFALLIFTCILCSSTTVLCQKVRTIERIVYQQELSYPKGSILSESLSYKYQADKKARIIASRKSGITEERMYKDPFEHKGVYKYYYDENEKIMRIKSPLLERKFLYDGEGKLKTLLFKGRAGRDKYLTYDRIELTYDKEDRIVKMTSYNGKNLRSENSYQYHREENSVKTISIMNGKIMGMTEIYLKEIPIAFNLVWYELLDPYENRFELFTELLFGFPSHIVCLSENSICDQQFTYTLENNRLIMKHKWENNIDGEISNHHRTVIFYLKKE